jgi:hypothetical protein
MQKQKVQKENKIKREKTVDPIENEGYTPKPRNLHKRFIKILNKRAEDASFIFGHISTLIIVTVFSLLYFSFINDVGQLDSSIPILFSVGGSFVGACIGSFFNGYINNFKNAFDAFSAGLSQVLLLWIGFIPVGLFSSVSILPIILILVVATLILPLTNVSYSAIGKDFAN